MRRHRRSKNHQYQQHGSSSGSGVAWRKWRRPSGIKNKSSAYGISGGMLASMCHRRSIASKHRGVAAAAAASTVAA